MKKSHDQRSRNILLLLLGAVSLQSQLSLAATTMSVTISTPDWPPFYIDQSLREPGSHEKGFAWEVTEKCVRNMNLEPTFQQYPIRRMFREMEQGNLALNIMSFKPDRLKAVNYGKEVVFTNTYGLWVRDGLTKSISSLRDLDSLQIADLVGLRTSDEYRSYLDRRLKSASGGGVITVANAVAIAKMLAASRADSAAVSNAEMRYRLKKLGLQGKVHEGKFTLTKQDYFFVVAKTSPVLTSLWRESAKDVS